MHKAYLFNPDNDIALARNVAAFTPPPAAAALRRAGAALPLWLAGEGDKFICDGINDAWLGKMQSTFGLPGEPWPHRPDFEPVPWGWSRATVRYLEQNGFTAAQLPCAAYIDTLRALSHRRTGAEVARRLAAMLPFEVWPPACEVCDMPTLERMLAGSDCVVKAPWSSSGRGITFSTPQTAARVAARSAGTIR